MDKWQELYDLARDADVAALEEKTGLSVGSVIEGLEDDLENQTS